MACCNVAMVVCFLSSVSCYMNAIRRCRPRGSKHQTVLLQDPNSLLAAIKRDIACTKQSTCSNHTIHCKYQIVSLQTSNNLLERLAPYKFENHDMILWRRLPDRLIMHLPYSKGSIRTRNPVYPGQKVEFPTD